MPAPNIYKLDSDWTKNTQGKFLKGKRVTLIEEILLQKKNKLPGPGTYEAPVHKIKSVAKVTSEKGDFVNNAKFIGM
jgi:hypothetical protein